MVDPQRVKTIVEILKGHGVVALPTETIYGLCCDPRDEVALQRLFTIKERDTSKPVLSVTGSRTQIEDLALIPEKIKPVLNAFWPGPLTAIFPVRTSHTLSALAVKDGTMALRLSPDPLITAVTAALNFPIIATSANISGKPFLQSAEEVRKEFGTQLDLIVETDHPLPQIPSTIIQCTRDGELLFIREGSISFAQIKQALLKGS
jgi:L-threonylcarbamoyladenylate synthase